MSHPSEAGHWYDWDGNTRYEVAAKNGEMRPTTLRDARKLNLLPSVTMILKCADRPGLNQWLIEQHVLAALTLPRIEQESSQAFLARVKVDAGEQAKKARERGTAIHAALQGYYEGKDPSKEFQDHVAGAANALQEWIDLPADHLWVAEKSFSHGIGFGGKIDLHCGGFVADFKTKEFGPDDDLKAWDEHAMQLAAYREGVLMPKARAAVCYVSTTVPGLARVVEIKPDDLERGWECFKGLLSYWQAKSRYRPKNDVQITQAA